MRTEADEVADSLRERWEAYLSAFPGIRKGDTFVAAQVFVGEYMPGETQQVIDNVAEALIRG